LPRYDTHRVRTPFYAERPASRGVEPEDKTDPVMGHDCRMSSKSQRIEVVLETLIESIALAEDLAVRVAAEVGFGEEDQYKISLAVHEGVMNAFQYGNEQRRERKIHVIFEILEEKLVIRVTDQGRGFRLEDVPDPRDDENVLEDSGRGVLLIKAFMDEVEVVTSAEGGAEVVMVKKHKKHAPHVQ